MLEKTGAAQRETASTRADPVLLEIFNNLFMAIAEQMGVTLANTASSVNIKERLDFSCALFDAQGQLIANAPHMPVHLGSMGESVQEILRRRAGAHAAGRCFRAECAVRRRHAPARRHRRHAGVPGRRDNPSSTWPRAVITPTSAASRRARCPRTRSPSTKKVCCSTTCRSSSAANFSRRRCAMLLTQRRVPGAQCHAESRGPSCPGRGLPERHRRAGSHDGALRARGGARLHAARAGQCRGRRTAGYRCAEGRRIQLRDGQRRHGARHDLASTRSGAKPPSISRAPVRSRPTTSTRRCR